MIPAPHYSHPDSDLLTIGAHILENDYILPEIRLKGNAYGCGFSYNPFESLIHQGSSFDPYVARTLDVFAQTVDYAKQTEWTQTDIDRAIIAKSTDYQKNSPSESSLSRCAYTLSCGADTVKCFEEKYAQLQRATPKGVKRGTASDP